MRWREPGHAIGAWAVGLCAYAACLFALAPATLLDAGLQRTSDGRLRLAEAQGTLWSGTGQLEIRDATGRRGIGRTLSWHFQPMSLLRGRLGFEVDFGQATKRFALSLSLLRVEIADAELVVPAAVLGLAVPKLALLKPTGDLLVHIAKLSFDDGAMSGNVIVEWPAAGSSLTPVSPLGDYELRLEGAAGGLKASLSTVKGPLQLEGKGSRGNTGPPVFFATARIDAQHQRQLAPFLRLIAIERSEGYFELQLNQDIGRAPGVAAGPVRQ